MPETFFTLRWPDGAEQRCYSPSTVITEFLTPGASYPMEDFLTRIRPALHRASDRVAAKYGFACLSAMAQLEAIEVLAATFTGQGEVTCISVTQ